MLLQKKKIFNLKNKLQLISGYGKSFKWNISNSSANAFTSYAPILVTKSKRSIKINFFIINFYELKNKKELLIYLNNKIKKFYTHAHKACLQITPNMFSFRIKWKSIQVKSTSFFIISLLKYNI